MRYLVYWTYRRIDNLKKWFGRRFTPAGRFTCGAMIAFAVVGLDTTLAMAYQGFTLIFMVLLVAFVVTFRYRVGLDIKRDLPRYATAGHPVDYDLIIVHGNNRIHTDLVLFEAFDDARPTMPEFFRSSPHIEPRKYRLTRIKGFDHFIRLTDKKRGTKPIQASVASVPPNCPTRIRVSMVPNRRGRIRFKGVNIARTDPFGLCRGTFFQPLAQSLTVLPRRYDLPSIQMPGGRRHHSGGVALTSSVGDSEEFVSLREYRPGDPLRKIHWKSWAKIGKPIVKEYQEEYFVRHVLVLDTFKDAGDAFEEAVSLAASFACTLRTRESLLDLIFIGLKVYCFTAGRGLGQTETILEALASVQPCRDKRFETMTPEIMRRAGAWSGCIFILLDWDEQRRQLVKRLLAIGMPVMIFLITGTGDDTLIDPGPMAADLMAFRVLRAGEIEKGLAQL